MKSTQKATKLILVYSSLIFRIEILNLNFIEIFKMCRKLKTSTNRIEPLNRAFNQFFMIIHVFVIGQNKYSILNLVQINVTIERKDAQAKCKSA